MPSAQGGEPGTPVSFKALQSCRMAVRLLSVLVGCDLCEDEKPLVAAQIFAWPEQEHRNRQWNLSWQPCPLNSPGVEAQGCSSQRFSVFTQIASDWDF